MSSGSASPLRPRIVVVGGGLSGLSAAISCLDAGAGVTLLEARPRLGGATWSFDRKGLQFDNGQHVHLACCTEYRSFLDRLGTADLAPLRGRLSLPVLEPRPGSPGPRVGWISRSRLPLPAPFHLAGSLLSYTHLSVAERLALLPPALRLRTMRLGAPELDRSTFGEFLERHGQGPRSIAALWDLISLPTTNLHARDVSLTLAAKVFKTGLLSRAPAADIAWSNVPLARLHVEPAATVISRLGGEIRTSSRVSRLVTSADSRGTVVSQLLLEDGETVTADAVVLAVQHDVAAALLPPAAHDDAASLHSLGVEPIVNVHLVFERKVTAHAVAAAISSPVQFIFDRTAAAGVEEDRAEQVLAVSLSGAEKEIGERPEVLIERISRALRDLFPEARSARVVDAVVTREHDATFRGVPGTAALRCGPVTGVRNLSLAGAWTDTGWPATMEGAVRSGRAAARAALVAVGRSAENRRTGIVAHQQNRSKERQEAIA